MTVLLKIDGKVDKRCGLHVHVDARHLGTNGLLTVEQTYDRLVGSQRLNWCLKKLVPKSRVTGSTARFCRWRSNRSFGASKFSAINFQSFREHGTIEFRMQGGSTNKHKIESWALLCQFLLNYAANPNNAMPNNWTAFLQMLPPFLRSWCVFRKETLERGMEVSARLIQSLIAETE
jgi:hypothetical protein